MKKAIRVICIGDELLDGRVADRNAHFLGGEVLGYGCHVARVEIIRDREEEMAQALERLPPGLCVVSGGLGPTSDDRTRSAVSRWAGQPLVEDGETLRNLERRFAERGVRMTPNNAQQALFPAGAEILKNDVGSAPGFVVRKGEVVAVFLPGVHREFVWCVQAHLPVLLRAPAELLQSRMRFFGIGESMLETELAGLEELAKAEEGGVGYRASYPLVEVKVTASSATAITRMREFVLSRVGRALVEEGDLSIVERIGPMLVERGWTVSTAESCTAGGIAAALTETAGSSAWFHRGWCTYSNRSKVEELGVSKSLLDSVGAVSPQVVCQMAQGARDRAKSDVALAVSGIAGPGGGTEEKPVGTVHFALACPDGVYHRKVWFRGRSREQVRTGSVYSALALLLWWLLDSMEEHRVDGPFSERAVRGPSGVQIPLGDRGE